MKLLPPLSDVNGCKDISLASLSLLLPATLLSIDVSVRACLEDSEFLGTNDGLLAGS